MVLISTSESRHGTGGVVAIAVAVYALLAWRLDFLCDDAYITFRYAQNWASGHGLVYHPGIDEPVEGYSEFLWAILLGVGAKFDVGMETLSRVVSFAAGAGLVGLSASLLVRRFGGSRPSLRSSSRLRRRSPHGRPAGWRRCQPLRWPSGSSRGSMRPSTRPGGARGRSRWARSALCSL